MLPSEEVSQRYSIEKGTLKYLQNSQENTCETPGQACTFIKNEPLAQIFSCEF